MRKSLGEKRKEISEEQIAEVTRLYGEFVEGEKCKIFPNGAFGFMRITVERPLRLRWEVAEDTVERLAEDKAWAKLSEAYGPGFDEFVICPATMKSPVSALISASYVAPFAHGSTDADGGVDPPAPLPPPPPAGGRQ